MVFQLVFLCITAVSFCALLKKQKLTFIISMVLSLFITLQAVSINLGGSLIDYKFYEHLNLSDVWSIKEFFMKEIIIFSLLYIIVVFLLYKISRWIRKIFSKKWIPMFLIFVCMSGMAIPNGIFEKIYSIIDIKSTEEKSFETALKDLSIPPEQFIRSSEIKSTPGKNIIVIVLESLERGYLEPPLQELTPNLQRIANDYTYYNMNQNEGSSWTTASIYTFLTGFPAFFRSDKNEIFKNTISSKIPNVGSVLKAANYDLTYLVAKKEFSGVQDMLKHFGFTVKSEKDLNVHEFKGFWGMHDKDLFEEAKREILEKSNTGKPFALFMSTISGHFPNGIYDNRMEKILPPRDSDIEFMASAVDYYIGDLFQFLKNKNLLETTEIYIFPDHLLMNSNSGVIEKFSDRGLYLITTADLSKTGFNPSKAISQIDLPRIILDGAGIKTNAVFLCDFIKGKDKEVFILENLKNIVALNEASYKTFDYSEGITLSLTADRSLEIIASTDIEKNIVKNLKDKTLYRISFDSNMSYTNCEEVDFKRGFYKSKTARIVFSISGNKIYSYLRKGNFIGIARMNENTIQFSKEDIAIFDDWTILHPKKVYKPNEIYLKSTGFFSINNRGKSEIFTGYIPHPIKRGINILYVENGQYTVKNFDPYMDKDAGSAFIKFVSILISKNQFFACVASDSAEKLLKNHTEELIDLGFVVLPKLGEREAYIAYLKDGIIREFTDERSLSKTLKYKTLLSKEKKKRKKERSRFIAHAGGMIDTNKSTNSLEALNLNYAKGFRYFELDIVKTKDGKYVATHDWKTWAKQTNYKGNLPPTEATYRNRKIMGKYTSMTLPQINSWFEAHPDAILVSDKINEPRAFSEMFTDKSRLMMELFTFEAFQEAKTLGLKGVLLTHNLVRKLKGDKVKKLKELGVENIAVNRNDISKNIDLYNRIKKAGIKTFVYNINFEKGKDEIYVFKYEMGLIYGMYADRWTFPDTLPQE